MIVTGQKYIVGNTMAYQAGYSSAIGRIVEVKGYDTPSSMFPGHRWRYTDLGFNILEVDLLPIEQNNEAYLVYLRMET